MRPEDEQARETRRLGVLASAYVMDTEPEAHYERIAQLASILTDAPVAAIAFIDETRYWIKSDTVDDMPRHLPRGEAICNTTLELNDGPLVLPDLTEDPRFEHHAPSTSGRSLRSYAGVPIVVDGAALGTLCVLDHDPRSFTERELEGLCVLRDQLQDTLAARIQHGIVHSTFEQVFEVIPEVFFVSQVERGDIIYVSAGFHELLGFPVDSIPTHADVVACVHPEDIETAFGQSSDAEEPTVHRMIRLDGEVIWVRTQLFPHDFVDPGLWVGVTRDISDEVRRAEQFEREVEERTEALRQVEVRLHQAQKLEAIGKLAGGIAHDFNNLLSVIVGYAQVAGDSSEDEMLRADMLEIEHACKRGQELVERLLAFGRAAPLTVETLELCAEVQARLKPLERVLEQPIDLSFEATTCNHWVQLDRTQLEQVLLNLVFNARDAMPDGGEIHVLVEGEVTIGLDDSATLSPGAYYALSIRDEGRGIPPHVLEHIFDPFFTTKSEGTGLGLSTVFAIMNSIGGGVDVHSEVGEGTVFRLFFPAVEAPMNEDGAPQDQAEDRTLRVLVVDDDDLVRRMVVRALKFGDIDVTAATGAHEALDILAESAHFDVLLSDVVMPKMSGVQLADIVRKEHPKLKIVLMSGHAQELLERDDIDVDAKLKKPFVPARLLDVLHDLVRK